ncbi:amine dehydrogenase [Haematobacter missouriensis]|uniref:Methylamine dehydrogenase (amicyanin) n=2 Tax=Haematobacter TaxID=366614 RepID=A0A212AQ68_9RHOB|nr:MULTISPECIES: methylamine dehydrogenase light chain [Haematobacter]KFI30239.1 amine dehydrogenase [Haematobacter missouriensis]OWJ70631.1 amine dehydrogenase [Haematobacter missouriensis]OWJ77299.1 amine dehydrogenase [Haematobacter genomosp. 1]OWJ83599.1 amine dehydrogenase [Haematobacter missouriensis]
MTRLTDKLFKTLDAAVETGARSSARTHGRRSFLAKAGAVLAGVAISPILPFDRRAKAAETAEDACDYWRHCALDGNLCSTSGGSLTSCPPGSSASAVSWVGTCRNPDDNKDYLVSYNDCCGKASVSSATSCYTSKGERPGYRMGLYNDINWCMANTDKGYHCTVSVVVGLADE